MATSLSIAGRPPRPVPWIWSQLTLAHNTLVVLSEILYLILKFAVAQVLEVRNIDGRLHIARGARHYDEWDPYVPPYDPHGPGSERNR
jgi:hypothetical protein